MQTMYTGKDGRISPDESEGVQVPCIDQTQTKGPFSRILVKKIKSIVRGWFRYMFLSRSKMAARRLSICAECEHGKGRVTCAVCSCYLKAKAESEEEECPLNKW